MAESLAGAPVYAFQEVLTPGETKSLWVFGYGSLCWKPGFEFQKAMPGYVVGYSRKFWQGNTTHRGTQHKPGRVATLIKDDTSLVHGVAFQINGADSLKYLDERECKLGGYLTEFTTFYPRSSGVPITALIYIATSRNSLWLGDAPVADIANQITESMGPCGYNAEYLLRLANFMHNHFPDANDDHLFTLEQLVRRRIKDKNMCLRTMMGNDPQIITFTKQDGQEPEAVDDEPEERFDSFQFTTRVPEKPLRCLNI